MKRILVFSDTHGSIGLCKKVIDRVPCELIIHAGDYVGDARELKRLYKDKEIIYVKGNCDSFFNAPEYEIADIDGVKIYIAHGHRHMVKCEIGYDTITRAAKERGCAVAVFGHTHAEYTGENDGVILLNPGSAKYGGTYGVIEIEDKTPRVCFIREDMGF